MATFLPALGTRTEITGANAAVQVASAGIARWVQFVADPANTSAVRLGDASVTATTGVRIAPGAGQMLPPQEPGTYRLSDLYVYVATGDKVSVLWGN
jgi:hypothetical protein